MIAVILAGGLGTRLRPLTCTRPKQLLPLGATTIIEYMIAQLAAQDIRELVLAIGYRQNKLQEVLGDGSALGVTLHYSVENKPLGTAGPLKLAEAYLHGRGEFLVLNGDIISDMNYQYFLTSHHHHHAMASIALYHVDNPSRYGVVDVTQDGKIRTFVEKPDPNDAPSNLINAGCYILNESVLDLIPSGKRVSIERDIFPLLCKRNKVYGWEHEGFWIDTGTPRSYLRANQAVLSTVVQQNHETRLAALIEKGVQITAPVYIGEGTEIAGTSKIGPNVSIGQNVSIGSNTRIRDAILFDQAVIGDNVILEGAVVGQGARIGENNHLGELVLIGDGATLHADLDLPDDIRVCPYRHVRKGATPQRVFC